MSFVTARFAATALALSFVACVADIPARAGSPYQTLVLEKLESSDRFGHAVDLSGDRAIVGVYRYDDGAEDTGGVWIYVRNGGVWEVERQLSVPDAQAGDELGYAVALDGDTALAYRRRSVVVFRRDANGMWMIDGQLTAGSPGEPSTFGAYFAIQGDEVFVADHVDPHFAKHGGAVYAFRRMGAGDWRQTQKIVASDVSDGDLFGHSIAISGDNLVIGAENALPISDGAAYFFRRGEDGQWREEIKITEANPDREHYFAWSVAISGDTVALGSFGEQDEGMMGGAAYIYVREEGSWVRQARLVVPHPHGRNFAEDERFGWSVGIDGDVVLVGAEGADIGEPDIAETGIGFDKGAAFLFTRSGGEWTLAERLVADDGVSMHEHQGYSAALDSGRVLLGAIFADVVGPNTGAAYVFQVGLEEPPSDIAVASFETDALTFGWSGALGNESSYRVYADSGEGAPVTLRETLPGEASEWTYAGLSPNAQYAFAIEASNYLGDGPRSAAVVAWTLAATPLAPAVTRVSALSLAISLAAGDGNPSHTEYAIYDETRGGWIDENGDLSAKEAWQTASAWSGLVVAVTEEELFHSFSAKARNGSGVETSLGALGVAKNGSLLVAR